MERAARIVALVFALSWGLPAAGQTATVDTTFAGAGLMTLPWTRSNLDRDVVAPAPDGGVFIASEEPESIRLLRLDARGVPISAYVGGGIARVELEEPLGLSAIHVLADGSLLMGGQRGVMRIDPTGRIDRAFGTNGRTRVPFLTDGLCAVARVRQILPDAQGWLLVATHFHLDTSVSPAADRGCTFVARLHGNGEPDLAFGISGNTSRSRLITFDATLRGGYVEFVGRYAGRTGAWVERMALDGTMIESFGAFGSLQLPDNGAPALMTDGRILADGSLALVGSRGAESVTIYRYLANHVADSSFAGAGRAVIMLRAQVPAPFPRYTMRILAIADGGYLVRVDVRTAPGLDDASDLYKVDASGFADLSFGDGGYARHWVTGDSHIAAWAAQPDGYVVFTAAAFQQLPLPAPGNPPGPFSYVAVAAHASRIQAVPDIVEFHNTIINHYFLAYDGPEAAGIDDGAAGPRWVRTGQRFRPGGTTPVCRFYGTPGVGPNSHFFTIEPGECEEVKRSPGWSYEGLGFYATRLANGQCPAPLVTVNRLYNNRAAANDSNHRYVTDLSLVPAMRAQGWVLEGPVFCAKP